MLWCHLSSASSITRSSTRPYQIIVFGGSGRVGGSTVRALNDQFETGVVDIVVAGRSENNWRQYLQRLNRDLHSVKSFYPIDVNNTKDRELDSLIESADLIVHTAGPFQSQRQNKVFESAIKLGKCYVDVCDDIYLSRILRSEIHQNIARASNARAIVSAGIWPGCSSLLACDVIEAAGGNQNVEDVEFSFFTAGSGQFHFLLRCIFCRRLPISCICRNLACGCALQ